MNRDEKLARVPALPPAIRRVGGRRALFPSEPGGGTWAGVNDAGVAFTLINWYAITASVAGPAVSRGEVVKALLAAATMADAAKMLSALPLPQMNPFRVIGFFPAAQKIVEWRWNLKQLTPRRHRWETNIWISSGFDEPGAQRARRKTFATARRQKTAGSLAWLRRLHRSHQPARGPYSICMHRPDAATVSYTEMVIAGPAASMRYQADAPCRNTQTTVHQLKTEAHAIGVTIYF